jgi:hypothetical protein
VRFRFEDEIPGAVTGGGADDEEDGDERHAFSRRRLPSNP